MVHFTTNFPCSDALLILHSTDIPEPGLRWRRHRPTNDMGSWSTYLGCGTTLRLPSNKQAFAAVRTAAYRYSQEFTLPALVDMMRMVN